MDQSGNENESISCSIVSDSLGPHGFIQPTMVLGPQNSLGKNTGVDSHSLLQIYAYICTVLRCFSRVRLFATPWTVARQALLSMGFSRQEYWSGLPWPPPGDLLDPGIEPESPALQADSSRGHWETPHIYWTKKTDTYRERQIRMPPYTQAIWMLKLIHKGIWLPHTFCDFFFLTNHNEMLWIQMCCVLSRSVVSDSLRPHGL